MLTNISDLQKIVEQDPTKKRLVLCAAADEHSLYAVYRAYKAGYIEPILVGDEQKIRKLAEEKWYDLTGVQIIHETDPKKMVQRSVSLIREGNGEILMKGHISTAQILSGVLNKEWGLRDKKTISHFALFEIPAYHKLLALTDVAMNIAPDLSTKIDILNNAVSFMHKIGVEEPNVAVLAAVEMVNEKMPATTDAALLSIMQRRGQIKNCKIDGPLAFDNAISLESKSHKGITGDVAGNADLLLCPDIEAGNVLYKAFVFFAHAKVASIILGAKAPIVLTSRSDSEETKLNSILLSAASYSFQK
ncbi:bifunctional enoyl-CoA hydratase/phosphate acetyltransferase [Sediminitomix flava]|uniref:Phosphate butyryltransferase n=1 Tax=Sediminitomix flava TaxID=379075 RepID=A0A315Z5R3_SEDFL|nr:bifunctional enoyl-CoA hydratase/phosphate acetyltransferase [Sediminitomix flava]PWJ39243.1 phosphate butyryltransferase [Sediminitomix flava]